MVKKDGKPRGKMSSYAFFVQTFREEHKKKHPGEQVVFSEFSKKCAEKWKAMSAKEKKRFEDMALKDKGRYEKEMDSYIPPKGESKKKRKKDPNAPKRALSAFFCFCQEERPTVRKLYPTYGVGDVAKELGKRWGVCPNKNKFEIMAKGDKARYEKDMAAYKAGLAPGANKRGKAPEKKKVAGPVVEEDDDDDDDDDDEEDDDEDDEDEDEDDE